MAGDGGTKLAYGFVAASDGGVVTWDEEGAGAAALGIFVRVGSRDEGPDEWGLAHLLDLTCYHAHVLDHDLEAAWSLLAAMVAEPWLAEEELERERGVVQDELREAGDDAEDRAEQAYVEALWGRHPIAHEVLGTPETLATLTASRLRAFHRRHYGRGAVTVSLLGGSRLPRKGEPSLWSCRAKKRM
jgi:predicted Zn-dependent peptidase